MLTHHTKMLSSDEIRKFLNTAPRHKAGDIKTNPSRKQILINILREHDQKGALRHSPIVKAKKECGGMCPLCKQNVPQLHAAHIGKPRSKIIESVLNSHPTEENIFTLIGYLDLANKNTELVIVCKKCNDLIEKETSVSTEPLASPIAQIDSFEILNQESHII